MAEELVLTTTSFKSRGWVVLNVIRRRENRAYYEMDASGVRVDFEKYY